MAQGCLVNQEVSCISVSQHQHKANLIAAVPGDPQGLSSCSKKCLLRVRGICFSFTLEKAALLTPPNDKWIQYPLEIPILVRRGSVFGVTQHIQYLIPELGLANQTALATNATNWQFNFSALHVPCSAYKSDALIHSQTTAEDLFSFLCGWTIVNIHHKTK